MQLGKFGLQRLSSDQPLAQTVDADTRAGDTWHTSCHSEQSPVSSDTVAPCARVGTLAEERVFVLHCIRTAVERISGMHR